MTVIHITIEVTDPEEFMDDDEFVEMFARCWKRYFGEPMAQLEALSIRGAK